MNLSAISIRKPVFTTLLTAAFVVLGLFGYRNLVVSSMPRIEFPTISVSASLPGADPETMGSTVAALIEDQLSTIPGITSLTSESWQGEASITIRFDLNRSIDAAALDVQAALSVVRPRLPVEMITPPTFSKINPSERSLMWIAVSSPTMPMTAVDEYAENIVKRQLAQVPGVGQARVFGRQKFAVRVQVNPEAAAVRSISLDEVRDVIAKANSSTPVGSLSGQQQNVMLSPNGQIERAEEYRNLVVAWRNGAPIKLGDVARVEDSVEVKTTAAWANGERMMLVGVTRQSEANAIEVVDAVRALLPSLQAQAPKSITIEPMLDRSVSIRDAIYDVKETLLIAVGLVVLVIFLFLGSLRATAIPAITLPISIISTFAVMWALGLSINNITLLALTLCVGFVVDDAIVMLENIVRHIEGGMKPFEAAFKGAREIGFTIVSITVSLIAAFIPVLLMGGVVGRVFREFAITMSVAIVVSGIVSLTLVPMLCARGLRTPSHDTKPNIVIRVFDRIFQGWLNAYRWSLDHVIRFKPVTLVVTLATLVGTLWLFTVVPKGFIPTEDTDLVWVDLEWPKDASFDYLVEHQKQVVAILSADPAVEHVVNWVHMTMYASANVKLKPKKQRDSSEVIFKRWKEVVADAVPGVRIRINGMQTMNIGNTSGKHQYTLTANSTDELYSVVPGMRDKIASLPSVKDVTGDLQQAAKVELAIDREKAAIYGISMDRIRQELFNAYGSRKISTIYTPSAGYSVILEMLPELQSSSGHLSRMRIKTDSGRTIPLESVVRLVPGTGPAEVHHVNQRIAVSIGFNLAPGYALSHAIDDIRTIERDAAFPAGVTSKFQGGAELFEEASKGQWLLVLAAIFATYIVLGILYESFIHPITIIAGLPSAAIGALIALMAFKMDLSVIAMIGMIMLIGIVKKNAIMMIDFAIESRRAGLSAEAAIREACLLRFRPIMMTTFAAIFGALPIALGAGVGAELRQPLGIAVVGGLILSQLLTLYITPVIYIYLDRFDRKLKRQLEQPAEVVEAEPQHVRLVPAE